jgi:hypothetical protein
MNCPIKDPKLWEKVKDLTGTDDEIRRLNEYNRTGKLHQNDYWIIRAKWTANSSKNN